MRQVKKCFQKVFKRTGSFLNLYIFLFDQVSIFSIKKDFAALKYFVPGLVNVSSPQFLFLGHILKCWSCYNKTECFNGYRHRKCLGDLSRDANVMLDFPRRIQGVHGTSRTLYKRHG